MELPQVNEAAEQIYDLVDATANLIFGAVVDPDMPNGEVGRVRTQLLSNQGSHNYSDLAGAGSWVCYYSGLSLAGGIMDTPAWPMAVWAHKLPLCVTVIAT